MTLRVHVPPSLATAARLMATAEGELYGAFVTLDHLGEPKMARVLGNMQERLGLAAARLAAGDREAALDALMSWSPGEG
jgi:thioredoxin-like negative regulator of GroEL